MNNLEKFKDRIIKYMAINHDELNCACCQCIHGPFEYTQCKNKECLSDLDAIKWLAEEPEELTSNRVD